jgi:glycosidase
MPWGDGDTVKDPAGTSYPDDKRLSYTAADEIISETSLYTYYKKLIMARKANPEIGSGEYKALRLSDTKVGGFISTLDGSSKMVLHNTTLSKQTIDLSTLTQLEISGLAGVFGAEDAQLEGSVLTLGSQTSVIIRLG